MTQREGPKAENDYPTASNRITDKTYNANRDKEWCGLVSENSSLEKCNKKPDKSSKLKTIWTPETTL